MLVGKLYIGGKKYISTKNASQITKYATAYISQLCREGKVPAALIGKTWLVEEDSLLRYKQESILAMHKRGVALPKTRDLHNGSTISKSSEFPQISINVSTY